MGQVAVGVREVRLELERGAIALYGLGYVAAVLVHGGEVAVRVRKGGVDLNGARVALQRALNTGTRKKELLERRSKRLMYLYRCS
jgi:hypothetical protein